MKGTPRVRRLDFLQLLGGTVGRRRGEVDERHTGSGPDIYGRGVKLRRTDCGMVRGSRDARDSCRIGYGAAPPPEPPLCVPEAAQLSPSVIVTAVTCSATRTAKQILTSACHPARLQ